jgi:hypothetical protein
VPTLDIGPVTKTAPANAVTGDTFNHVVTIPVTGTGTASWTAAQTSFRDQWSAGLVLNGGAGAVTFGGWTTNPVCTQSGASIVCTGGSIAAGGSATVTIPMLVTGCGLVTDNAEADPNNNVTETNELNNTAVAATSVACDTFLSKTENVTSLDTSAGPANVTYTITLTDILGTRVARPSTVSDALPAGFLIQSISVSAGDTGTCVGIGTNSLSCTDVGGPEPVVITYVAQVQTSLAAGNYDNSATVTTPGDTNGANNSDVDTVSVYPWDLVVTVVDSQDPVPNLGGINQYAYTVTVTNNSVGGHAAPPFFIQGGLQLRNADGSRNGARDDVATMGFAHIVSAASTDCAAVFPSLGFGPSTQRYSCAVAGLAAGGTVTLTVVVEADGPEPDGFPEVALDGEVADTQPSTCGGGGSDPTCAPETSQFAPAFNPPAAMTANNRTVEFTDID